MIEFSYSQAKYLQFLEVASKVLGVSKEYLQIRRSVLANATFRLLTVYVFSSKNKDNQRFYQLSAGEKEYYHLPNTLKEFKEALNHNKDTGFNFWIEK